MHDDGKWIYPGFIKGGKTEMTLAPRVHVVGRSLMSICSNNGFTRDYE